MIRHLSIAEVIVVGFRDFTENGVNVYYFKVADTDGVVLKGAVRKIRKGDLNKYPEEHVKGWITPEEYRERITTAFSPISSIRISRRSRMTFHT